MMCLRICPTQQLANIESVNDKTWTSAMLWRGGLRAVMMWCCDVVIDRGCSFQQKNCWVKTVHTHSTHTHTLTHHTHTHTSEVKSKNREIIVFNEKRKTRSENGKSDRRKTGIIENSPKIWVNLQATSWINLYLRCVYSPLESASRGILVFPRYFSEGECEMR